MLIISDRAIRFFEFILRMKIGAIAFWPFIIAPTTTVITPRLLNHERIHLRQQIEMLVIPFHIWYLVEYFTRGYYSVSFEKEAYANDWNLDYLKTRKFFTFVKYLKK
jgi:hypothetical protein